MKRRVCLIVDIDTEREGNTMFFRYRHDEDKFKIEIRKPPTERAHLFNTVTPFASLAHELGHFVGTVLGLPGQMHDPRMLFPDAVKKWTYIDRLANHQLLMHSEEEAWDVAACLFSLDKARQAALGTYQEPDIIKPDCDAVRESEDSGAESTLQ